MSHSVDRATLETTFGAEHLTRVPAERLNPVVTHGEARRFLIEVGVPTPAMFLFEADDPRTGLVSAVDDPRALKRLSGCGTPPGEIEQLVCLGWMRLGDQVLLNGTTGEVHIISEVMPRLVNTSLDRFCRSIAVLYEARSLFDPDVPDDAARRVAADDALIELWAADPEPFTHPDGYWYPLLQDTVRVS
jgi:SUKH-4 immunity protein